MEMSTSRQGEANVREKHFDDREVHKEVDSIIEHLHVVVARTEKGPLERRKQLERNYQKDKGDISYH